MKTFAEAAAFGEALVLAVGGQVALEALKLVGPKGATGQDSDRRLQPDRLMAGRRSTVCCRTSPR